MIKIGIDGDTDKSGVAFKNGKEIELYNMTFFKLFDYLQTFQGSKDVEVYIECGFLNKSNWHKVQGSNAVNAQIGQRTGENLDIKKLCLTLTENTAGRTTWFTTILASLLSKCLHTNSLTGKYYQTRELITLTGTGKCTRRI